MRVVHLSELDQLAGLRVHWNELASGIPFRSWDWLEAWWRHYGHGESRDAATLVVLNIEDASGCVAIAPWFAQNTSWSGRTLRFLGTGEICSDYLSLLAPNGMDAPVAEALADWLIDGSAPIWDLIELSDIDAGDPIIGSLAAAMGSRGCAVDWRPGATCWRVHLPPTWDEYLGQLSRSHRKQLRRMERRLFDTGRVRLRTVQSERELDEGMPILVKLHQARQESLGRDGCFASPKFLRFHTEVTRRLLASRTLRLHWVELDGRPVAAEYHLAGNSGIYAYQGGVDPATLDESPGQLATLATLKLAIEQGYRYFDFLRGDEPYKAHWCAKPYRTVKLRIVPDRLSTRLRHNIWVAAKGIQTLVSSR